MDKDRKIYVIIFLKKFDKFYAFTINAMENFTKSIAIDDRNVDFSFVRVITTSGIRYYVTVILEHTRSYLFQMDQQSNNTWKIIDAPKVPAWIHKVEHELSGFINADSRKQACPPPLAKI